MSNKRLKFQEADFSSFIEKRRNDFLNQRKQKREEYFERFKKLASKNQSNVVFSDDDDFDIEFDFSFKNSNIYTGNNTINNHAHRPLSDANGNTNNSNEIKSNHTTYWNEHKNNNNNDSMTVDHKKQEKKNDTMSKRKNKKKHKRMKIAMKSKMKRMKFVKQLMIHDWMVDIPNDLATNWVCGLRLDGERCLVISHNGFTLSRNKSGNLLDKHFNSGLPSGNYKSQQQNKTNVLDCIFIKEYGIYYCIDIIIWNDRKLYENDSMTRLWWLKTKLNKCNELNIVSKLNKYKFIPIITYDINIKNLKYLYNNNIDILKDYNNIKKDGILFYHKYCRYEPNVSCPLVLVWKDKYISQWFIDTNKITNKQCITLKLQKNGTLTTHDSELIALSVMPQKFIKQYDFKVGNLIKFSINDVNINKNEVKGLTFIKKASLSRILPDIWSKIVFQYQARHKQSITFAHLINSITKKEINIPETDQEWNEISKNADDELLRIATLGIKTNNT